MPTRKAAPRSASKSTPKATFFESPADFRKWLATNHARAAELWVGYFKRTSGKPSITWPQSVDEALCFGWIDGVRYTIDDARYRIRFSPRKPGSVWSSVNIARVAKLIEERRLQPPGVAAYEGRRENRSGIYSYEQRRAELEQPYAGILAKNTAAARFFHAQPLSYRKKLVWWVVSAKKDETRLKRLDALIAASAKGKRLD